MSAPERVNKLKAAMQGMANLTVQPLSGPDLPPPRLVEPQKSPLPPSRRGKRVVSAYVDASAFKQLKLLEEALNDLFRKYSKSPVA